MCSLLTREDEVELAKQIEE
ncbi:MAG: hypothetical protein IH856_23565 [Deltaproteobacteria bacterium]|nr:hypothetical protein [Deltaproteobacteria bacterium]